MADENRIRHSHAEAADVISDQIARAKKEAANGLLQAERVRQHIVDTLDGRPFKLRPSIVLGLNRCAIDGLDSYAGSFRPGGVVIGKSKHQPPDAHLVPELVDDLCDYVNENWETRSSIHLAAMIMWRMNWIHPFTDGNGRTSRAVSYLVLCCHAKVLLAGSRTITELIVENRQPYYDALEAADEVYKRDGHLSSKTVLAMEELLTGLLATQLRSALDAATNAKEE